MVEGRVKPMLFLTESNATVGGVVRVADSDFYLFAHNGYWRREVTVANYITTSVSSTNVDSGSDGRWNCAKGNKRKAKRNSGRRQSLRKVA